jgi:uncharacterized protein YaeQ
MGQGKFIELSASFYRFQWQHIQTLASLVKRTMDLSITISGDSAYVSTKAGECEVSWVRLQPS